MRRLIKDTVRYLPSQVLPAVAGLIAIPLITRASAPEAYGEYAVALATMNLLLVCTLWVGHAVVRLEPSCRRDGRSARFTRATVLATVLSVATLGAGATVVVLSADPVLGESLTRTLLVAVLAFAGIWDVNLTSMAHGLVGGRLAASLFEILITLILVVGERAYGIVGGYEKLVITLGTAVATEAVLSVFLLGTRPRLQSAYITGVSLTMLLRPQAGLLWPFVVGVLGGLAVLYRQNHFALFLAAILAGTLATCMTGAVVGILTA